MNKFFILAFVAILLVSGRCFASDGIFSANLIKKELLKDLAFAEMQIFDRVYSSRELQDRLEQLELATFGAIQNGDISKRIHKLKKSLTNVASGGNGLQYTIKRNLNSLNLAGNGSSSGGWHIGNIGSYYYPNRYNNWHTNVMPPRRHHHSHRLPPPPRHYGQNYNDSPITNGDFSKNYSIGTTVRILDD